MKTYGIKQIRGITTRAPLETAIELETKRVKKLKDLTNRMKGNSDPKLGEVFVGEAMPPRGVPFRNKIFTQVMSRYNKRLKYKDKLIGHMRTRLAGVELGEKVSEMETVVNSWFKRIEGGSPSTETAEDLVKTVEDSVKTMKDFRDFKGGALKQLETHHVDAEKLMPHLVKRISTLITKLKAVD